MAISRRSFLKTSAAGAAVSLAAGPVTNVLGKNKAMEPGPGNKWPGRVVINYNKDAAAGATFKTEVIKKMIDDSIMLLTDQNTVGEAWKTILPSITASSKIAIKIPLGFIKDVTMAVHWSSIKAIVDGLQQMDIAGTPFPAANITIYDNPWTGTDNLKKYGFTAENIPGVNIVSDSNGSGFTDGAKNLQYAKSLNSAAYLINVFRPGGHMTMFEGFTLGFKNHFGTYKYDHSNQAIAYLRDINSTGAVFNKTALSICFGLNGAKEVGMPTDSAVAYNYYVKSQFDDSVPDPQGSMPPDVSANTIIMSTDPVSAEMQAIKMMRLNKKPAGKYGVADMPKYLRASAGVSGALSDATYNIGVIDENDMDIRTIINGNSTATIRESTGAAAGSSKRPAIAVSHLKSMGSAFIEYRLPQSYIGSQASIKISDLKGAIVHARQQSVAGAVSRFSWDEKAGNGRKVPAGVYVVRIVVGKVRLAEKLVIPR